jgi:hypothetical protein
LAPLVDSPAEIGCEHAAHERGALPEPEEHRRGKQKEDLPRRFCFQLASPSAAKRWRNGAQGLWRATMAVGAVADAHRRWLLPNPPAR